MNSELIDLLRYWIQERENIRVKKARNNPKPWTKDTILQKYRFCNVNREDDKTTKWIKDNIRLPYASDEALWFNLALARFINHPLCLKHLGYFYTWDPKWFNKIMSTRQNQGLRLFSGAYMIRAGTGADSGKPKHEYLADRVFTPLWDIRKRAPLDYQSCQAWDDFFHQIFGMGDFMRNQIITDMKYTRYLSPEQCIDWHSFILAGPGTVRGLNRLHERPLKFQPKVKQSTSELVELRRFLYDKGTIPNHTVFNDLNNLSNCLCEFDKYCRVYFNEGGRPKQGYPGIEN